MPEHEQHHGHEQFHPKVESAPEHSQEHQEHRPEQHVEARNEHSDEIEKIRHHIQHEASHGKDKALETPATESKDYSHFGLSKEVKSQAYRRTLNQVRRHLSAPQKVLSKVIHQPTVDAVSELGEKTVGRPSGVLGGGIVAFSGSALLLYLAKHYGYRYNFLVFFMLFVSGFAVGLVVELLVRLFWRRRTTS